MVPELPSDPAERPLWLRRLTCTWPVRVTAEDEARASFYAAGRDVRELKSSAANLEDFLRGLEQCLTVSYVRMDTVARVAQMHQRTNQFNLTTLRSTETEIAALIADETRGIALLGRVRDRFGDHGIVIAATVAMERGEAVIRSLLMSCRVIGRQVEHAFMGELLCELKRRGVVRVQGAYIPTAKNGMVRDFYASCGFELLEAGEEKSTWSFAIGRAEPPSSQFVATGWEA
jgi:FkbH-like protein